MRKVLPASPAPTTSLLGDRGPNSVKYLERAVCPTKNRHETLSLFCKSARASYFSEVTCMLLSLHLTQRVQHVSKRKHPASQLWVTAFCMLRAPLRTETTEEVHDALKRNTQIWRFCHYYFILVLFHTHRLLFCLWNTKGDSHSSFPHGSQWPYEPKRLKTTP